MYMEGARLGFGTLHTAVAPVANGTSNPAAETTLHNLEATGLAHALDVEALAAVSAHFRALAARQAPAARRARPSTTPPTTATRCRAGWSRRCAASSTEMRRPELFEAALEECGRVRAEFGWPIMVTPFSQFVGTQAVMNVMDGERYATIPDDVIVYFLGHFGTPPAPPDPDVADRVLSLAARGGAARRSSRSRSTARASASARGSPTRSCCCA